MAPGTEAKSYKDIGVAWSNQSSGGARLTYSNINGMYLSADVIVNNGGQGGPDEVSVGSETTEWSSAKFLVDVFLYEGRSVSIPSIRLWRASTLATTRRQGRLSIAV